MSPKKRAADLGLPFYFDVQAELGHTKHLGGAGATEKIAEMCKINFGWTMPLPPWARILALLGSAFGYGLSTWAMVENAYFSMIVRVQSDRGQRVCSTGPYRFVRHPGYLGTILFELLVPIVLGSWWALIPGAITAVLTIVRTALEDKTLQEELPGYQDYTGETRYRLIPWVW